MRKLLSKYWPVIAIMVVLLMISYYVIKARQDMVSKTILSAIAVGEGLRLDNIHYIQNNPDQGVKWTLDAREVKFSKDRQHIFFKDFKLILEPESRPSIELEGKGGDFNKTTSEINLRGNLNGSSDNGYKIVTEHLLYNQKGGYLNTEEHVEIIGPFFSISGQGMHYNLEQQNFLVKSQATALIKGES